MTRDGYNQQQYSGEDRTWTKTKTHCNVNIHELWNELHILISALFWNKINKDDNFAILVLDTLHISLHKPQLHDIFIHISHGSNLNLTFAMNQMILYSLQQGTEGDCKDLGY